MYVTFSALPYRTQVFQSCTCHRTSQQLRRCARNAVVREGILEARQKSTGKEYLTNWRGIFPCHHINFDSSKNIRITWKHGEIKRGLPLCPKQLFTFRVCDVFTQSIAEKLHFVSLACCTPATKWWKLIKQSNKVFRICRIWNVL